MTDVISYPTEHEPESLKKTMEWIREQYIAFHDIHLSYLGLTVEDLSKPPELKFSREYVYFRLIRRVTHYLDEIFKKDKKSTRGRYGITLSDEWFEQENNTDELAHLIVNHGDAGLLSDIFFADWFAKKERQYIPTITWFMEYRGEKQPNSHFEARRELLHKVHEYVYETLVMTTSPASKVITLLQHLVWEKVITPPSPREDVM